MEGGINTYGRYTGEQKLDMQLGAFSPHSDDATIALSVRIVRADTERELARIGG